MSKMTEAQAKKWLATLEETKDELVVMTGCITWLALEIKNIESRARGNTDNTIDFKTGLPLARAVKPWPDSKMRNFEEIGKSLDQLCRRLNKEIPE